MDKRQMAVKLQGHPYYVEKNVTLGEIVTSLNRIMKAHGLSEVEMSEGIRIVCADPETYYYPLGAFNNFAFRNQCCVLTDTAEEKRTYKKHETEQATGDWRKTQAYWDGQYVNNPALRQMKEEYRTKDPSRFITLMPDGSLEYTQFLNK